jgi:fatty acid desaturase
MLRRRATGERSPELRVLAKRYPQAGRAGAALSALAGLSIYYGLFALYCAGKVPVWGFIAVGLPFFVRYFERTHEEMHARQTDGRLWHALRYIFHCSGPLQLGYPELTRYHRLHHAYEGTDQDPDLWMERGTLVGSFLVCMMQPEQAVVRYVRDVGVDRRALFDLCSNFAIWCTLACVLSTEQFVVYNCVTRFGNGVSWWVFTHILHRAETYRGFAEAPVPTPLAWALRLLLGRHVYNAIAYHFLHHAFAHVPSQALPDLSRSIVARAAQA